MSEAAPRQSLTLSFLGLAGIGVAIGLMHLPLSLQLSLTLSYQSSVVRTLVMLLYPIAMALTGLGAVLAMKRPALAGPGILRMAGLALGVLLLASLRLNFLTDNALALGGAWIAHLTSIGLWYVTLGAGQTVLLARIRGTSPHHVGHAWAVHLLGLMVGYLGSEPSVVHVGANAVLLSGAVALIMTPRASLVVLLPALLICQQLNTDVVLEDWRDVEGGVEIERNDVEKWKSQRFQELRDSGLERLHLSWSRFGQVQVFQTGDRVATMYNLKRQYEFRLPKVRSTDHGADPRLQNQKEEQRQAKKQAKKQALKKGQRGGQRSHIRDALYARVPSEAQIIMVGVGAGRSLQKLTQGPSITAVERDPAAAHFFSEVRPDLNGGVFTDDVLTIADGRFALETLDEPVDAIIMESSRYQPPHALLPATSTYYLHTEEAIASYLDSLKVGGVLIAEFTRVGESRSHQFVPMNVRRTLQELGAEVAIYRSGSLESVTMIASKTPGATEPWAAALADLGPDQATEGWNSDWDRAHSILSDDQPFPGWQTIGKRTRIAILGSGAGLFALTALVIWAMHRRQRDRVWNATRWFFVLGYAHTGLQLHAFHAWRTYFGDELVTVIWLIVAWLAYGAVGSVLAERIRTLSGRLQLGLTTGLLLAHLLFIAGLPFDASAWIRWSYAALALIPGGLLMGLWLPLGLRRADTDGLGVWLAADALGTLAGAAVIYLLMVPLGGTVYLVPAVVAYLWLARSWPAPSGPLTTAPQPPAAR